MLSHHGRMRLCHGSEDAGSRALGRLLANESENKLPSPVQGFLVSFDLIDDGRQFRQRFLGSFAAVFDQSLEALHRHAIKTKRLQFQADIEELPVPLPEVIKRGEFDIPPEFRCRYVVSSTVFIAIQRSRKSNWIALSIRTVLIRIWMRFRMGSANSPQIVRLSQTRES